MITAIKVFDMDRVLRSKTLYAAVREMTISPFSGMNKALNAYVGYMMQRPIDAKAVIAYSDRVPIGWALYASDPSTDTNNFDPKDGTVCFQIFVKPEHRRKGIGTRLMARAAEIDKTKTIRVYEFNNADFFRYNKDRGIGYKNIWAE